MAHYLSRLYSLRSYLWGFIDWRDNLCSPCYYSCYNKDDLFFFWVEDWMTQPLHHISSAVIVKLLPFWCRKLLLLSLLTKERKLVTVVFMVLYYCMIRQTWHLFYAYLTISLYSFWSVIYKVCCFQFQGNSFPSSPTPHRHRLTDTHMFCPY